MTTATFNPGSIQNNNATVPADLLNVPEVDQETISLHGAPIGRRYTIGFADLYYTLWIITTFNKVENVFYQQNLSMDFAKAQHKLVEITGCNDFEVDLDLRGESGRNFFRPLAAKRYEPTLLAISRFAGSDMRMLDPSVVYHREYDREGNETIKKMSGLLWATYLNKDEKTVRGLRRRLIARECLVTAGILVKVGREYITPEQIKTRQVKALKETAINGHHETEGKRLELKVKRLGNYGSFETQYGTTFIITLLDESGRLFKYMGSNRLDIGEEDFISIKGTVKHDTYKEQAETKLQRIKIL
jgi:hypothetical protein